MAGGRGLSLMIFSTLDSPPFPASGLQGDDYYAQLDDFTRKASISRFTSPRHRASLPVCCPAFSTTVELCFFPPSVESSRVLTALSLRLQVDFSPLLVFLFPEEKEHAVKVQSGLTATKHRCLVRRLCPDVGFLCKPGSGLHFRLQGEDEVDDQWPPVHALT